MFVVLAAVTGHLSPFGAVAFSVGVTLIGVVLLVAAPMLDNFWQSTWELFGLHPRRLNRPEVFIRYKLGPIALVVGGVVLAILALLGSLGIGPTRFTT